MSIQENINLLRQFKFKYYWKEFLALLGSFFATPFIAKIIQNKILEKAGIKEFIKEFTQYLPYNNLYITGLTVWLVLFVILLALLKNYNWIIFKDRKFDLDSPKVSRKDWCGQGALTLQKTKNANSIIIENANTGHLLKYYYWRNCRINFEVKLKTGNLGQPNTAVGIIFRAKNLENYLMIQLGTLGPSRQGYQLWINPHIRFLGNWDVVRRPGVFMHPKFIISRYLKVILDIRDDYVFVNIDGHNKGAWHIPEYTESFLRQYNQTESDPIGESLVPKIDFRNKYGRIGFRASSPEKAEIRKLRVEPI